MARYIDADKANDFIKRSDAIDTMRRFNGYFDDDTITRFEIALTNYIQAADVVEVVRCKDCKWYEPKHILHSDGTKTYVDDGEPDVTVDVGINVSGQCVNHRDLKIYCKAHDYENIVIFRKPDDYCSYGERAEE